jgi:hypothetical protein
MTTACTPAHEQATQHPQRLQPKMTRGGFRVQFVLWSIWTALRFVLVIRNLASGTVWNLGEYLLLSALMFGMAFLGFLLYVRQHDGHFCEEEEAKRAEWDRRGRTL